jgi:hypothetical protein
MGLKSPRVAVFGLALGMLAGAPPASAQDAVQRAGQLSLQLDNAARSAQAAAAPLRGRLIPSQVAALHEMGVSLARSHSASTILPQWRAFVTAGQFGSRDVAALVQWVLSESYLQASEEVEDAAEKVKAFNDVKRKIREETQRQHASRVSAPTGRATVPAISSASSGGRRQAGTKPEIGLPARSMATRTGGIGGDEQLATLDLQSKLQRHQKLLQAMSSVSKQLHDTAMAIIRQTGG